MKHMIHTQLWVRTYLCYVQAVLLGGVVPVSGDGRDVQTVNLPYGRVAAVKVAAVGTAAPVVWTLVLRSFTAHVQEKRET